MLEIVETNAAAILMMIALWCTVTWAFTYMYITNRLQKKQEVIDFLDMYIEEIHADNKNLRNRIDLQDETIMELEGHTCVKDWNITGCIPCQDRAEKIYAEQGGQ